ncbi:MAG: DUF4388 domain-containing protein [Anaerolineae bacterium]
MALKGNLKDFSFTQLLNLINLARKTGRLTLTASAGSAQIFFKEGKMIHASRDRQDVPLTTLLFKLGRITQEQSQTALSRSEVDTDKELGLLLINAGYVDQNDIIQSLKSHMLEIVYPIFTWSEGSFRFEPNFLPPEGRITVPVNLENIIMEGSRRVQEWEMLQDELPDLDMALKFTERPGTDLRHINLTVEEWRVISFINPRNSIREIAQFNSMSEFEIRKIVYRMLSAGLIDLVEREGRAPRRPPGLPWRAKAVEGEVEPPAPVKRGVILRLIDRIRGL